jgi:peptidoglycan/LPS O-acetylase OafA/YrhL
MENNNKMNHDSMKKNQYLKFVGMLVASFIAMYITMYLNTYSIDHVYFSLTRFYMTCLGISAMAVIMWFFMRKMYQNKKKNIAILLGSFILFISALGLVRTQKPIVGDLLWLRAMIPHHSIAILTSERAAIQDPKVRELADDIIKAQRKEITEMKAMIKRLENEK